MALTAAIVLIVAMLFRPNPDQPSYQGRTIDYWFSQLPCSSIRWIEGSIRVSSITPKGSLDGHIYGSAQETPEDVLLAFQSMGADAVPFLISKLRKSDDSLTELANRAWLKCRFGKPPFSRASVERAQAVTAFVLIRGLLDVETSRQLVELTQSEIEEVAAAAKAAAIGGDVDRLWETNVVMHLDR